MPYPQLDTFENDPAASPEVEQQRRYYAVEQFLEDAGDTFFAGTNNCNARWINEFLAQQKVPVTLRNLQIAHRFLSDTNRLEKPFDNKYTVTQIPHTMRERFAVKKILSTAVTRHSPLGPAERQLIAERPERFEELGGKQMRAFNAERAELNASSEIGKPVSPALKTAYRQSLAQEHNKQGLPKRWAEARALARLHKPELKPDSAAFNAEVARKVAEVS